jgi:copper chaperone for superoxide dismutase
MTCEGCAKDISGALHKLPGIAKVEANVKDQLVSIEGTGPYDRCCHLLQPRTVLLTVKRPTAAPSAIVEAIQATGRDAILRGSGTSNSKCSDITPTCYPFSLSQRNTA